MTLRVAAAAALGTALLAGCAAPSPAQQSASASAGSGLAGSGADLTDAICENMRLGGTPSDLALYLVRRGLYPDRETAVYRIRGAVMDGCPQYASRP